jgi:hypothetical protein
VAAILRHEPSAPIRDLMKLILCLIISHVHALYIVLIFSFYPADRICMYIYIVNSYVYNTHRNFHSAELSSTYLLRLARSIMIS